MEEHGSVDTGSNQSETDRKRESASDTTSITISSGQTDTIYYFEENAEIKAHFGNSSAVRFVKWKRETDTGSHDIDETLPKYIGTLHGAFEQLYDIVLKIKSCDESDAGTYFLLVSCADREICSNKVHLQVFKGSPIVTLRKNVKAYLDGSERLTARIQGFQKKYEIIWKKNNQNLYLTNPKYKGSENYENYAVLNINNVKKEDEGTYTIEVNNEFGKGESSTTLVVVKGSPEVTLNEISPVHLNESVELKATFQNFSRFDRLSVILVKHDQDINIPHRKYEVVIDITGSAVFRINNFKEEDVGTYTVEVHNKYGKGQSSQKLEIIRVSLKQVPLAYPNECVKLKAKIEGFSKYPLVNWKKDDQDIDFTGSKYEGSKRDGDSAVLCINDVKENDDAIYTIEVSNGLEKVKRSQKLVVIRVEGEMIFISGPVVVSPSETITFHAFLPDQNVSNVKWWKIKDQSKKEVEIGSGKYSVIYEGDNINRFEIFNAEKEDSATYQCIADNMKSNTIYVHVDDFEEFSNSGQGNVIRFYALQAVSAKVMRKVISNLPNTFEEKMKEVKTHCRSYARQTWAKEFLSINPNNSLKDLDISKMYTLYRNLNRNSRTWKTHPEKNEIKQADNIERIRFYRNWVCHSDASEMETAQFNTWMLDLLGAIRRLSDDDHVVIKECCVILNRVFTTVEFKDTMETLAKEPEKLGQYILNKEEDEMKIFEKEPEKLGQHIPNKESEEIKIYEREPEQLVQLILNKEEEEMKIFEKEPEKLGQHMTNKEEEEVKIYEREPEKLGQHILDKKEEEKEIFKKEPEKLGKPFLNEKDEKIKIFEKEPEKFDHFISNKEEEEMENFEKEPEKLGQHITYKEEEEVKIYEREPKKLGKHILDKKEGEKEIFEKEPEKLDKHFLNEEDKKRKIFEKEAEKFGQPLLSENIMFWIRFMLFIACSLIFSVLLMYVFNLKN